MWERTTLQERSRRSLTTWLRFTHIPTNRDSVCHFRWWVKGKGSMATGAPCMWNRYPDHVRWQEAWCLAWWNTMRGQFREVERQRSCRLPPMHPVARRETARIYTAGKSSRGENRRSTLPRLDGEGTMRTTTARTRFTKSIELRVPSTNS